MKSTNNDLKINTCYGKISAELLSRLSSIKLLAFDVDGSITDGGVYYDNEHVELKRFNTRDGFGIAALRKENIECAVITGRSANLTVRRMQDLHVEHIVQGEGSKDEALNRICQSLGISTDEVVCFGDDLNDMPMFRIASVCACPCDAHPFIKQYADYVSQNRAGYGAMRELCDLILISKGILNADGGYADERY